MMAKMNKALNMQTTLLIDMAGKMGFKPEDMEGKSQVTNHKENTDAEETDEEREAREENELVKAMLKISDKIKAKEKIIRKDKKYYTNNFDDMHEDLRLADPSEIILEEPSSKAPAKKKLTHEEKHIIILTFFEDDIPKQLSAIDKLLSEKTGTKPNKGNTHSLMKEMLKSEKIETYNVKKGDKVFYVLPDWMDGKKLKKEYLNKIS